MDVDDIANAPESDTQAGQGQGPPCPPHYYPDPSRRVIKEGDMMYCIRAPTSLDPWGIFIQQGYPVKGLDQKDSLKCLQDKDLFEQRLQELGDLKAQANAEQDADKDAITAHVKKRKIDSNGRAQSAQTSEDENVAPQRKKSGSAKRAQPDVQKKAAKANDFQSFFGLPCNCRAEKNAQAIVIKNLRGDMRSRISNAKKPRGQGSDAVQLSKGRLHEACVEVAKYLVGCYNHPDSSLEDLQNLIDTHGDECICQIRHWLDIKELFELDEQTISTIFTGFQTYLRSHAQNVEPETRKYLIKSPHRLSCTKVHVHTQSALLGCYSGPHDVVAAKLKQDGELIEAEKVTRMPHLCKDLRNKKGINVVAFLTSKLTFKPMPGPFDAFPEGHIFLSCEICQGKKIDCNCTEWLDSVGITERDTFEFDLDEMVVPAHMDNYCFGQKPWVQGQGVLNLRRFTADENSEGGVQIVGLTKDTKDQK